MLSSQNELNDLRKKVEHLSKDQAIFQKTRRKFDALTKQQNTIKWEMEALRIRCEKLAEERDRLRDRFEDAVLKAKRQNDLKNLQLERKVEQWQLQESRLRNLLSDSPSRTDDDLCAMVECKLQQKEHQIDSLSFDLVKMQEAYNDLMITYENAVRKMSAPRNKQTVNYKNVPIITKEKVPAV